jgi:folate-binding protein YgfZ
MVWFLGRGEPGIPGTVLAWVIALEIDAAAGFLPVAESRRLRAGSTANLSGPRWRRAGRRLARGALWGAFEPGDGVGGALRRRQHGDAVCHNPYGGAAPHQLIDLEGSIRQADRALTRGTAPGAGAGVAGITAASAHARGSPMTAPACPPQRYRAIVVDGRDAASFLQGQLTQDLLAAPSEALALGALLTNQGRVLAIPFIEFADTRRTLLLPDDLAPGVLEHLRRYVLRAKVTLALQAPDPALLASLESLLEGRLAGQAAANWPLGLVRAGLPEVVTATSAEWIPQMLNLDLVGAISFRKGCYTGQEIVARTQNLGRIKRRMFRVRVGGDAPPAGAPLMHGGAKVGEVVLAAADGASAEMLAVLGLETPDTGLVLGDGREAARLPLPYPVG